jgi:hypothetical protein
MTKQKHWSSSRPKRQFSTLFFNYDLFAADPIPSDEIKAIPLSCVALFSPKSIVFVVTNPDRFASP